MVFPIRTDQDARSIFCRIADEHDIQCEGPKMDLAHFFEYIPTALDTFQLSFGTEKEFSQRIAPLCQSDLADEDLKAQFVALKTLLSGQKNAFRSLEESLQYIEIPPFNRAIPPLANFLKKIKMKLKEQKDVVWFFSKFYKKEHLDDANFATFHILFNLEYKDWYNKESGLIQSHHPIIKNFGLNFARKLVRSTEKALRVAPSAYLERVSGNDHSPLQKMAKYQGICRSIIFEEYFCAALAQHIRESIGLIPKLKNGGTATQLRDELYNYQRDLNEQHENREGETFPQFLLTMRFCKLMKWLAPKYANNPPHKNIDAIDSFYKKAGDETDEIIADLRHLSDEYIEEKDVNLSKNLNVKINFLISCKSIYLFNCLRYKYKAHQVNLHKMATYQPAYPIFCAYRELINNYDHFGSFMYDALEFLVDFRNENRLWFRELYKLSHEKLEHIANRSKVHRIERFSFMKCNVPGCDLATLPKPAELEHRLQNIGQPILDQIDVEAETAQPPLRAASKKNFTSTQGIKGRSKSKGRVGRSLNVHSPRKKDEQGKTLFGKSNTCAADVNEIANSSGENSSLSMNFSEEAHVVKPLHRHSLTNEELIEKCPGAASFPFFYQNRVTRWFLAKTPLHPDEFSGYEKLPIDIQRQQIIYHGFSKIADQFINRCIKMTHGTRSGALFFVPAELTYKGVKERGYLKWIEEKGICFHRYFHVKSDHDLIDQALGKKFHEVDFPPLQNDISPSDELSLQPAHQGSEECRMSAVMGTFTIFNRSKEYSLRLYLEPHQD